MGFPLASSTAWYDQPDGCVASRTAWLRLPSVTTYASTNPPLFRYGKTLSEAGSRRASAVTNTSWLSADVAVTR